MNKSMNLDDIDINIKVDGDELFAREKSTITVTIRNRSKLKIENSLLKFVIDEDVFDITDDNIKLCVNKFSSVGNISPGKVVTIHIPVEVKPISTECNSSIFCTLKFDTLRNGTLVNSSCNSENLFINILESNILTQEQFVLNSSKKEYLLDENMDYEILVSNSGKETISDLIIYDFIPEGTRLVPKSISSSKPNKTIIKSDRILIRDLIEQEQMYIKFSVSVFDEKPIDLIENKAYLKYCLHNKQCLECESNSVKIKIKDHTLFDKNSFVYMVDKNEVLYNDTILHTILIKNRTSTTTRNLSIKSNFIKKLKFIENSLMVNDIYRIGEDICDVIKLGELDPYEEFVISYKTRVLDVFDSIDINSSLSYDTPKRSLTQTSNTVKVKVMSPIFNRDNFIKKTDKEKYSIGEIVDFTIELLNTGTLCANNIFLKDTLSPSLQFIPNTVSINDFNINKNIIEEGLQLNNVHPNEKLTIKYKAKVIDVDRGTENSAILNYKLENVNEIQTLYTNTTPIKVFGAKIGDGDFKKELSSYTVTAGDIITVKLSIENRGNVDCDNLKIQEPINSAIEFVEGSIVANDNEKIEGNIFNGISFSKLKENESLFVRYQIKILGFPKPNPIDDRAILTYTYVDNHEIEKKTVYSSKAKLYVHNPVLSVLDNNAFYENTNFTKYCHSNDYVFYSLTLENKGNVNLEDIYLGFKFPEDLLIDFKTLKINNSLYKQQEESNILLPNLNVSQRIHIEFYAKHQFIKGYNLESFINLNYSFRDLKSKEVFRQTKTIKEDIIIINPDIEIVKFISDKDIDITNEFTKNIKIKNCGNVKLENVILNLNEDDFLRYSEKTIFVNENYIEDINNLRINYLNVDECVNISIRYNLSTLPVYHGVISSSEVTATYQFNKNYSPINIKRKSNSIELAIKNYSIEVDGKCSSKNLILNKIYTYVFKVTNVGNVNCNNMKFDIDLPDYIDYVEDSFNINGKNFNLRKIDSPIHLKGLNYNESLNLTFDFSVNKLPYKKQAKIDALLYTTYEKDDDVINKTFKNKENLLNVENIDLEIVKNVSSDYLQSGDILKVQTIINNTGSVDVYDLNFRDNHEDSLFFVNSSVYVDGEHVLELDPTQGINIDKLPAGQNILLSYEYEYIPKIHLNRLSHYSDIEYSYIFDAGKDDIAHVRSNIVHIDGLLSTFKQFSMENEYRLKDYEPSIGEIVNVFSEAKVENYYEINTIKNRSIDNTNATGKKMVIKGYLLDRIEYVTKDENTPLYMLERVEPFSIFVNLPSDCEDESLFFKAKCDDTFYKATGPRGIFVSSLISIEGLI